MNRTFNSYPDENYANVRRLMRQTEDDDHKNLSDKDSYCDLKSNHELKCGFSSIRVMGMFVVLMMFISVIFSVSVVLRDPPSDAVIEGSDVWIPQWNSDPGTGFLNFLEISMCFLTLSSSSVYETLRCEFQFGLPSMHCVSSARRATLYSICL